MSVLIVIPTVTGREDHLARCVESYENMTVGGVAQICIFKDYATCGEVWNLGAKEARELGHDFVHMTADDLVPENPGWYEAAVETVEADSDEYGYETGRFLPCAKVFNPDGSIQVQGGWHHEFEDWEETGGGSVPFCRTEDWIDIPNIHYWSDNAYDYAQNYINKKTFVARTNYAFTHYTAQAGRKGLDDREREIFEEWKKTL